MPLLDCRFDLAASLPAQHCRCRPVFRTPGLAQRRNRAKFAGCIAGRHEFDHQRIGTAGLTHAARAFLQQVRMAISAQCGKLVPLGERGEELVAFQRRTLLRRCRMDRVHRHQRFAGGEGILWLRASFRIRSEADIEFRRPHFSRL